MADRFLIAPLDTKSGLRSNFKSWLIPDEAFEVLNNAYVWRGRVRKRFGSRWITNTQLGTRLRVALTTSVALPATSNTGAASGFVPGGVYAVGQSFVIGSARYLVTSSTPGAQPMSISDGTTTATYNISNGAYNFVGAPINSIVYFFDGTAATTDGGGYITTLVPGTVFQIGQMFSIGTQMFTVNLDAPPYTMLISGTATSATFDTTTGIVSITGAAPNTALYYYPALPVMGLLAYDSQTSVNEPTIAFDTQFAYQYVSGGWERLAGENVVNAAVWTGSNSQLFYGFTWVGDNGSDKIFMVTNFNETEPNNMRYLDTGIWYQYAPQITNNPPSLTTEFMFCARILTVFHNHVLALNTWEGTDILTNNINFQNRVRWTGVESPTNNNPLAWRQDVPGHGGGLDAATTEAIVGIEFIQDRLIVYFERSTWELVWTGNAVQPFVWQQINTELGCESTFSVIPFDKMALGISSVGIHACNGIGVERIDVSVPELIDDISNDFEGASRVYGIRDYVSEMVYWAYPSIETTSANPFPNKTLLYNYVNSTWSTNDDVITCFGYFQEKTGVLWTSTTVTWADDVSWNTGGDDNIFRTIVAGNQQGYTYIIDQGKVTNAPSLQITDILVVGSAIALLVPFNCVAENSYIYIQNVIGTGTMTSLNGVIFEVLTSSQDNIAIALVGGITGTYLGGGTISIVSNINITSKQFSFYIDKGGNTCVNKIDFQVSRTGAGQIGVQFRTSSSTIDLTSGAIQTGAIVGNGTLVTSPYDLYPYEANAERLIHPFYTSVSGSFVQMTLTMTPAQMLNVSVMNSDFQLHSMTIFASPTNRLQ